MKRAIKNELITLFKAYVDDTLTKGVAYGAYDSAIKKIHIFEDRYSQATMGFKTGYIGVEFKALKRFENYEGIMTTMPVCWERYEIGYVDQDEEPENPHTIWAEFTYEGDLYGHEENWKDQISAGYTPKQIIKFYLF